MIGGMKSDSCTLLNSMKQHFIYFTSGQRELQAVGCSSVWLIALSTY